MTKVSKKIMLRRGVKSVGNYALIPHIVYDANMDENGQVSVPVDGKELDSIMSIPVSPENFVLCKTENGYVQYHRCPTMMEIKQGYGAVHYIDIPESICRKQDGELKKWCNYSGDRYYR